MSRSVARRLLASSQLRIGIEPAAGPLSIFQCLQKSAFSKSARRRADEDGLSIPSSDMPTSRPSPRSIRRTSTRTGFDDPSKSPGNRPAGQALADLANIFGDNNADRTGSRGPSLLDISNISSIGAAPIQQTQRFDEPHHFHIYATKHNTHITLTRPTRDPILSVSCGNIGFKKSGKKHYDSAFQLAGFVMAQIIDRGLLPQIKKLEVILRGFGPGREAVTKALLGTEGRVLRAKVVKVSDATRIKFGGTRSRKPRRLG